MPFAYYARLTRAQQAIYRRSDAVTEVRLPRAAELRPLVAALETALRADDRAATERATARLVAGLAEALQLPPVAVQVLAVRPHARWGELHGLYTNERGRPPKIQLWMRTAKRRRVVAFRTYLRTLLHELGHHYDYTHLRLADSFHTEGFYKRESSLFHQLVPGSAPATLEDFARLSRRQRLARLGRTPDRLADALRGARPAGLGRRPAPEAWAAVEVLCHLRDHEEWLLARLEQVMLMDEPCWPRVSPERWAEDRQYRACDAAAALAAFRRRRAETLALLRALRPEDWERAGVHLDGRGRRTVDELVTVAAWHDDNHLDQLRRALAGRP